MRTSFVVSVSDELMGFIQQQYNQIDPSALVNKLIHDEMKRKGFQSRQKIEHASQDPILEELELSLDADTPAAD